LGKRVPNSASLSKHASTKKKQQSLNAKKRRKSADCGSSAKKSIKLMNERAGLSTGVTSDFLRNNKASSTQNRSGSYQVGFNNSGAVREETAHFSNSQAQRRVNTGVQLRTPQSATNFINRVTDKQLGLLKSDKIVPNSRTTVQAVHNLKVTSVREQNPDEIAIEQHGCSHPEHFKRLGLSRHVENTIDPSMVNVKGCFIEKRHGVGSDCGSAFDDEEEFGQSISHFSMKYDNSEHVSKINPGDVRYGEQNTANMLKQGRDPTCA
jgi:hypothetical protein